ncbi:START domain-containing protein [Hyalangium rubrum]|uniref:START domain-containing protein n=1 Tax=Hyalangium rubrum TaxID=3103134 RepID=A0ABU5H8Z6_9BACT|nr:START domain-containing protein [Hyalangium sp. s54d21]MDY7229711.1 START domain-containing protein [Hyalangium sp. s54d21]
MLDVKWLGWCGAVALVLGAGVAGAADEWKTVEDDPVVIKVRPRPDGDGKEVWAEGDVEADAYDVQTALRDAESFRLWMPYVKESRRVSTREDGSWVAYAKLNLPVITARDYAVHIVEERTLSEDGQGEYLQRWKAAEGEVPERQGVVRLKHNEGIWQVTSKGEGKAHIVYKFSVDPGGSIPKWAANFGQKDGVLKTLEAVEERAKKLGQERKKGSSAGN